MRPEIPAIDLGHAVALVAIAANEDPEGEELIEFDNPSGELLVVSLKDREIVHSIERAGEPDATGVARRSRYGALRWHDAE